MSALFAGCNAGSSVPAVGTGASPSPTATATSGATSVTQSTTIGTTAGQTVSAPAVQGYTPLLSTPSFSVPLTGTVTSSTALPTGVTTFSAYGPVPLGARSTQSRPNNANVLMYMGITPTTTTTASGSFSLNFALPKTPDGTNTYYLAFYDGSAWHTELLPVAGTLTSTGVSFTNIVLPVPITLLAGTNYAVALFAVPSNATPAPNVLMQTPPPAKNMQSASVTAGTPATITYTSDAGGVGTLVFPVSSTSSTIQYVIQKALPGSLLSIWAPQIVPAVAIAISPASDLTFPAGGAAHLTYTPTAKDTLAALYTAGIMSSLVYGTSGSTYMSNGNVRYDYTLPTAFTLGAGTVTWFFVDDPTQKPSAMGTPPPIFAPSPPPMGTPPPMSTPGPL